jgi:hypothetical protein
MKSQCDRLCAKFCGALEEALRRESTSLEYYENIIAECDFPEIRMYFQRFVVEREALIASLQQKMDEIQIERDITDRIGSSYA